MTRTPIYTSPIVHDASSLETIQGGRFSPHGVLKDEQPSPISIVSGATNALLVIYGSDPVPSVTEVTFLDVESFCDALTHNTSIALEHQNSPIPRYIVSEVVNNLIFANFQDVVISISNGGHTVSFSDRGPGIIDIQQSLRIGFSSATSFHKRYIRGVGAGFEVIQMYMRDIGGSLSIENNLDGGTVVTLHVPCSERVIESSSRKTGAPQNEYAPTCPEDETSGRPTAFLNERQHEVLVVSSRYREVGPQLVSDILGIALSTAYRDLTLLESLGLLITKPNGKRAITEAGITHISKKDSLYDS